MQTCDTHIHGKPTKLLCCHLPQATCYFIKKRKYYILFSLSCSREEPYRTETPKIQFFDTP